MKKHIFFALCWLSVAASTSASQAKEIEEVKVTARPFRIMLEHIQLNHRYNAITNRWYYVDTKKTEEPNNPKKSKDK